MNVALLGYGFAGKTLHAPLIQAVPELRLAVVLSSDASKVHRDLPGMQVTARAGEVFADPVVDLVVIATPNQSHYQLARSAMEAGKHVVVDKPFTTTVAEAAALIDVARATGRVLSVFQSRRWDGDFLTLRQLISSGELGEITHLASTYDRYRPAVVPRWREQPGPASGIWFDLGSHLADQALQLFGMPESVFADLGMQRDGAQAVDYFHVLLRYGKLRVVLHGSNLVMEETRRFEVHGSLASYVKGGMDSQEPAMRRGERPGGPNWGVDPRDGILTRWIDGQPRISKAPAIPGDYRLYYRALANAILCGTPNPVPAEEALDVMKILELACRSAAEGRELPAKG